MEFVIDVRPVKGSKRYKICAKCDGRDVNFRTRKGIILRRELLQISDIVAVSIWPGATSLLIELWSDHEWSQVAHQVVTVLAGHFLQPRSWFTGDRTGQLTINFSEEAYNFGL